MVWIVEKRIFHHLLDLGFERVEVPIRVKFEFELKSGCLVPGSTSKEMIYNRPALERRYPHLDTVRLQRSIEETVDQKINRYFMECGFLSEEEAQKR